MSWSYRVAVLSLVAVCGLAPQLDCFTAGRTLTAPEMDCCEKMAADCGTPTMTHACCQTVTRTDVGVVAKVIRDVMPAANVAATAVDVLSALPLDDFRRPFIRSDHAPPPEPELTSSILRI
jgi:hypothetical protein